MVQRLNVILVTSPELTDFRKRLKNLESRVGFPKFLSPEHLAYLRIGRASLILGPIPIMVP